MLEDCSSHLDTDKASSVVCGRMTSHIQKLKVLTFCTIKEESLIAGVVLALIIGIIILIVDHCVDHNTGSVLTKDIEKKKGKLELNIDTRST